MPKKQKGISLIFIDTETTGLSSTDQILQFAAIYGIFDGKKFHEEKRINQYMNITTKINFFAQNVHGISKSMVAKYGYIDSYIDDFLQYIDKSDHIIGHNISFDIRMLQQDCERIDRQYDWDRIKTFCTMKDINHISDLPKKRPRLGLLYTHLFDKEFSNAHDAMADIEATKDCFLELTKRGDICLE
ncbi:MAG: 3'-5' exonuclease [Candidatus Absconditabacterales bacterium]